MGLSLSRVFLESSDYFLNNVSLLSFIFTAIYSVSQMLKKYSPPNYFFKCLYSIMLIRTITNLEYYMLKDSRSY